MVILSDPVRGKGVRLRLPFSGPSRTLRFWTIPRDVVRNLVTVEALHESFLGLATTCWVKLTAGLATLLLVCSFLARFLTD